MGSSLTFSVRAVSQPCVTQAHHHSYSVDASTRTGLVVSEYDRLAIGLYFVTTLCITAVHEWCTRNSVLATEVTRDGTLIGIITKTGFTHLRLALNLISCDPGATDHPSSTLACRCVSEPRHRISPHFTTAESLASTGRWSTTLLPARWAACPPNANRKYHDVALVVSVHWAPRTGTAPSHRGGLSATPLVSPDRATSAPSRSAQSSRGSHLMHQPVSTPLERRIFNTSHTSKSSSKTSSWAR